MRLNKSVIYSFILFRVGYRPNNSNKHTSKLSSVEVDVKDNL